MRIETSEQVRDLLNQFPRPVVLKPSMLSEWPRFAVAALIFVCSLYYIASHFTVAGVPTGLLGAAFAIFMGTSIPTTLTLDCDGFTVRHLFGRQHYPWNEVGNFHARDIRKGTFLFFDRAPAAERWWVEKMNRAVSGR